MRMLTGSAVGLWAGVSAKWTYALQPEQASISNIPPLTVQQSRAFVQWFRLMIQTQLKRPTPRWQQRDCAGLVRFAAAESLRLHDAQWERANGLAPPFPPELNLTVAQQGLRHQWQLGDGSYSAYASAIDLIQHNSRLVTRDINMAQVGDLLFFDQGDDQHLMVWLGNRIVYHNGQTAAELASGDTGMRALTLGELLRWRDTRWRPHSGNPNFGGVYRLHFVQSI